jgi:hypothetical protein
VRSRLLHLQRPLQRPTVVLTVSCTTQDASLLRPSCKTFVLLARRVSVTDCAKQSHCCAPLPPTPRAGPACGHTDTRVLCTGASAPGAASAGQLPGVAAVLAAGNHLCVTLRDVVHQLVACNALCVVKLNPCNDYVGADLDLVLRPLISRGFVRLIYGGAEQAQVRAGLCCAVLCCAVLFLPVRACVRARLFAPDQGSGTMSRLLHRHWSQCQRSQHERSHCLNGASSSPGATDS